MTRCVEPIEARDSGDAPILSCRADQRRTRLRSCGCRRGEGLWRQKVLTGQVRRHNRELVVDGGASLNPSRVQVGAAGRQVTAIVGGATAGCKCPREGAAREAGEVVVAIAESR